ncbi:MAG TPA: HK97 family phage prohead protease [Hypericibacter adhaerens]|uniref:HK97 family phage prohead protease n=1 Tax=Hypericibacter adhaerens TaxID=2602016 RepID=UPI002BB0EDA8|nr:HK97 family phage prohead protease [Hypericibacter adhaerens]HWA42165.1 HK97 family phage prohead protease [Hypericibacter adhaerens]
MDGAIPIDVEGRFAGYASVFGRLDEGGDMVMPGAFRKSLGLRGKHRVKMLFQHDPKDVVGTWDRIVEDDFGLHVEGRLVPEVPRAEALRRLIARGAIDGLSIGFRTIKATREGARAPRKLWEVDLWEISIVTFPMMDLARIAPGPMPGKSRLNRSLEAAISVFKH